MKLPTTSRGCRFWKTKNTTSSPFTYNAHVARPTPLGRQCPSKKPSKLPAASHKPYSQMVVIPEEKRQKGGGCSSPAVEVGHAIRDTTPGRREKTVKGISVAIIEFATIHRLRDTKYLVVPLCLFISERMRAARNDKRAVSQPLASGSLLAFPRAAHGPCLSISPFSFFHFFFFSLSARLLFLLTNMQVAGP